MAGGGGGAVGMRLNIMTALYLPILGYAMSTFDLNPDALVLNSENLEAYAIAKNRTVALGDRFEASIYYELKPTDEQEAALDMLDKGAKKEEDHNAKMMFKPIVNIDEKSSVNGIYFDTLASKFFLDTDKLRSKMGSEMTKTFKFKANITAKTVGGKGFEKDVEETFTVFKPYVEVQSNAVPSLIAECENSLRFNAIGYDPTALVLSDRSSGQVVNGNTITWSPKGDTTVITVSARTADGQVRVIDKKGFRIKPTPSPVAGLRRENERKFLGATDVISYQEFLELVIRPDDSFVKDFPKDAKYRIDEVAVEVARRGLAPEYTVLSAADLRTYIDKSGKGKANNEDIYIFSIYDAMGKNMIAQSVNIRIDKIVRINYQGKSIPVDVNTFKSNFVHNVR
ncbi:MAG: hypothetical protein GW823_07110 [Bacteroidetes bacterium]|nr:hypothetical protein [Bacteroidota bacterium]